MAYVDFVGVLHQATSRNYVERVVEHDKAACAEVACRYGAEYWDGDRKYGFGGYTYDGRWRVVAEAMVKHYDLKSDARILDVGCGKGFLLHEFTQLLPDAEVAGIDISEYALANAKEEVRDRLTLGNCTSLPWPDRSFDFIVSITTLHNLYNFDLWPALREIQRVGRGSKHITMESYRSQAEKANLLYWQLTCRAFHTPDEWQFLFDQVGYDGDFGCIYFE